MKRDYRDYLEDSLTAIDESEEFTKGISFEEFANDRKAVNAVVRTLEVMGEAAGRIPDDLRAKAPGVPWRYMIGMRHKLIHEYFGVDLSINWEVVKAELPPVRSLRRLSPKRPPQPGPRLSVTARLLGKTSNKRLAPPISPPAAPSLD